jgi:hypothetical protein
MLINPLYKIDNFDQLQTEVLDIIEKYGSNELQIICQGLEKDVENWKDGTGRIEELEIAEEQRYINLHPYLSNSVIESLINKHNGFRTRIMIMPPNKTYSVHADPTPRIHIPILTNDESWMIWPHHSQCKRLTPGFAFWTDTTKKHTFINGGLTDRIHIVMCVNADILSSD